MSFYAFAGLSVVVIWWVRASFLDDSTVINTVHNAYIYRERERERLNANSLNEQM